MDGLQSIVGKLGGGDRIVIRTIADSYTHTEKLIDRCMPYCPPMSFWDELFSNCTGGLILNHKRALISEIRASVRGRLDQFKELEHSELSAPLPSPPRRFSRLSRVRKLHLLRSHREFGVHSRRRLP